MGESAIVEVDGRGRVLLPRALREFLGIHPGDKVRINVERAEVKNEGSATNPLKAAEPACA